MHLATSLQIKELDKLTSEKYGIPLIQLMENAGSAIYDEIKKNSFGKKFAVFCGKGNNGGDGFVLARLLNADGCDVKVYFTHTEAELSAIAKLSFEKLKEQNVRVLKVTDSVDTDAVIVDALLGISVFGAPRGIIKTAIDKITSLNNTVISVDIPSGLSADDGSCPGSVVKADYTYTLAVDKVGLNTCMGEKLCGEKKVLDIGIPKEALKETGFLE